MDQGSTSFFVANRPPTPGWYSLPQLCSITTGALIFLSGGMNMALSLGWREFSVTAVEKHFHYCWFIAVIIGTVISIPLRNIIPKKFIMAISALLILGGGVIFTSTPNTIDALVAGRYLNGIAVGLVTVPFLMHCSEISRPSSRGACLAMEQYAITFGIAIQMISTSQWDVTSTFPANRFHGILDIILAMATAISLFYFIESPVDYIRMGNEAAALDCLSRLQRPPGVTTETSAALEEHKYYVREQEDFTTMQCIISSVLPMIRMILFRSMMLAFTFSMPLTMTLQYTMFINHTNWPPILAASLRICGGFLSLLLVDKLGRKLPALLSTVTIGALILSIAVICNNSQNLVSSQKMVTVTTLCLAVQFFAGLFAPLTSAYMGEAFPLRIKSYLMGACVIAEQVIQIVVICKNNSMGNDGTFMAEGIIIVILFVCLCAIMPETKRTSLRDAQERFCIFFNWKLY